MNLVMIKEGSILIAPAYQHAFLRNQLLQDKNAIPNIRITTLSSYINDGHPQKDTSMYAYYQVLKDLKNTLTYNKQSADTYSFSMEIMSFINEMKHYDIPVSSLLEENPFQKENKTIIENLYNIPTTVDVHKKQLQRILHTKDFTNVYIFDENASYYEEKIYALFCKKGATRIHDTNTPVSKVFYSSLNQRQEVESIAQHIITNQLKAEDIHVSILDNTYLPYIHQVFDRYEIPYYILNEKENGDILQRFLALVSYYIKPDLHSLVNLFQSHTFTHKFSNEFVEYVQLHQKDIHDSFHIMDDLHISNDVLSSQEIKKLTSLEEKARSVQEEVLPILDSILQQDTILSFLLAVDAYICDTHPFSNKDERTQLLSIRSVIKDAKDYLHTKEDLNFIMHSLQGLRFKVSYNVKGACISSFDQSIHKDIHFVLGCTQANFPAFQAKSGIFDENYYAKLPYPSLEERYDFHMKQCIHHLENCKHLICFTCISNIDGKACESSLEIEDFVGHKPSRYPLVENYRTYKRNYTIHSDYIKPLFIRKDNTIHGSISALEKYMKCPYSYFLKYGLRIKEPVDYTFNLAKCGTLLHYVLEVLINRYEKEYVYASKEEIEAILDEKIEEIIQVYPKEKYTLYHLKKRLITAILTNLNILKDQEAHSSLVPSECEYNFNFTFPIDDTYSIALQGIIDRIDMNQDFIRIIDYKSSAHSLKEENVFSAQQLQLITYLLIAQKEFNRRPLGAFYYSLALPSIKMIAGKLKKRPLSYESYTEEDYYKSFLKDNRIQGWVCDDKYIEAMDDTGSHIVGVNNSKSGISARTIYNYDTLDTYMHEIYKKIGFKLLSGDISCEAKDGACLYCPYARICMKANITYDSEELIEVTSDLYLKGGRKDANME